MSPYTGSSADGHSTTSASDMDDIEDGRKPNSSAYDTTSLRPPTTRPLQTSQAQRKVWLVKLPDFLMERWMNSSGNGTREADLGSIRIHEQTQTKPSHVTLHLPQDPRYQGIPKDYELSFLKNTKPNSVFSEDPMSGTALEVVGKIEQECLVRPAFNEAYHRLIRERNTQSNRPKRTIQVLDQDSTDVQYGILAPVREAALLHRDKQKFSTDRKRDRLPKADVLDLLFTAFERRPNWTLKDLSDYSKQPTAYLRDVLQEIAVSNKRGELKNTFELKPEYSNTRAKAAILERFQNAPEDPNSSLYASAEDSESLSDS